MGSWTEGRAHTICLWHILRLSSGVPHSSIITTILLDLSIYYYVVMVQPFLSGSGSMCFGTGWVPIYCFLNLPTTLQLNFVLVTIIFKSSSIIIDTFYAPFRLIRLSPSGRDLTTRQAFDVRLSRSGFLCRLQALTVRFRSQALSTSDS